MSGLRPDAKEFEYRPSRQTLTSRLVEIRSRVYQNSNMPSISNIDLQQQQVVNNPESNQSELEVPQLVDQNRSQINRVLPEFQQPFEGGHNIQHNESQIANDPIVLAQQVIQESIDGSNPHLYYDEVNPIMFENLRNPTLHEDEYLPYKMVLDDFKSTVEIIIHDPAQFDSALELLILDLEPYFEDQMIMDYVATAVIDFGWDTNFHYLAAKLALEFETRSKYFRIALHKAVNNELKGQLLDLSSFSLLISEFFCVFPAEFIDILYNCMDKLFEEPNRYDRIKIICKILKLNALKLESFNSVRYSTLINKLKAEKPRTDHQIQVFIDHTLSMIEREHTTTLNGNHRGSEQIANDVSRNDDNTHINSQREQRMINNNNSSRTLFNMYGFSDIEDCGIGGVSYGPDLQPLSEEEMVFLNNALAEADLVEDFKHFEPYNDNKGRKND